MNAITTTSPHPLRPQNFSELMEFAKMAARSTLVPRDYLGKPENIVLAIQMGSEIGLAPMQSLQNISVINGRPAVWGDAMLGLCRQSPVCKDVVERFEGEGANLTAVCVAKRVGSEPIERRFSMDDAVRAGLASKAGTWQQYPSRMLQHRARGFALRDAFPDVLKGLIAVEEAQDIPEEKFAGKTIESTASDERSAINDAVPLKPAAAAAPMQRHPKVTEPPPKSTPRAPRTGDEWNTWADKLEAALATLYRRSDLDDMVYKPAFQATLTAAPPPIKRDIDELLSLAYERLPAEPIENDPTIGDDELPEIKGAEKVAAGD